MDDPDYYAELLRYEFVSSDDKLICTGQTNGSYNYALRDSVLPPDKKFIPVRNRFGGIDYVLNINYKKK